MAKMEKVLTYWADAALDALESMMMKKEDPRNPAIAEAAAANLKILCKTDELMSGGVSAAMDPTGVYDGGSSYSSRHWVSGHYSRNDYGTGNSRDGENTITRMMDAADPREREIIERVMRKI